MDSQITQRNGGPIIEKTQDQRMYKGLKYDEEFEEISQIGNGAFSTVYKAFRPLDGTEYAIKKVPLGRSADLGTKVSEEVQIHSKLDHPNVVTYQDSWFELTSSQESTLGEESSRSDGKDFDSKRSDSGRGVDQNKLQNSPSTGSSGCEGIVEQKDDSVSSTVSFRANKNILSGMRSEMDTSDSNAAAGNEKWMFSYTPTNDRVILYIQLTLCDQTLNDWLNGLEEYKRAHIPPETIKEILFHIFKGLNYIHSQKVVHHDIKPANIFVSSTEPLKIQLGDFGLACSLKNDRSNKGHGAKGTLGYMAPEQLKGECNIQSDVYSAGMVLLDLLIPTRMEQAKLLEVLKKGRVPNSLPADYRKLFQVVSELIREDPASRPTTHEVLEAHRNCSTSKT